jgi:hypothetical protein
VLKKIEQWDVRVFYAGMIALMLGLFLWFAGSRLLEASVFLVVGVVYAFVVVRFVSQSFRAFTTMLWTFQLNFWTLLSLDVEGVLGIPAAGPWFIGFIVGGIAGGYIGSSPRSGSALRQTRPRKPDADGKFSGGLRLALINGACVIVLLGIGTAQLALLSPTAPAVTVLALAVIAGWTLFRFPPPLHVRNGLIMLGLPVVFFVMGFVGGATNQTGLPHAWAYGALAGILIGGRFWAGPRLGEPRPPFNGPSRRRRQRRPRPKQTQKREKPSVGVVRE